MSFKQIFYSLLIAALVIGVSLFAATNYQEVTFVMPFVGEFKTKLFLLIVVSYVAGFLTAAFLSLLTKIFSISLRRGKKNENRHVSETVESGKKEDSGENPL